MFLVPLVIFLGVKFGFKKSCLCKRNDKYEVWHQVPGMAFSGGRRQGSVPPGLISKPSQLSSQSARGQNMSRSNVFEHLLRPCCAFLGRQQATRACSWESYKCKILFFDTDVEHNICTYNAAHLMCLALSRLFRNCREMLDPSTLIRFLLYTCNIKVETLVNQLENKS